MVDWTKIKSVNDIQDIADAELFDESVEDLNVYYTLNPNLSDEEIEDAMFWKDYLRGIILIDGMPGQGKGMLAHMIAYKFKRYFGLTVITDTRPRKLFGNCLPFSQSFLLDQLERMEEVANPRRIKVYDSSLFIGDVDELTYDERRIVELIKGNPLAAPYIANELSMGLNSVEKRLDKLLSEDVVSEHEELPHVTEDGRWVSSKGEVLMRKAVWLLDEFGSKYMNRREPNNPIHRTLLFQIFPIWRHLDVVIIGMATEKEDLDQRCYPKLTTEIRCTRLLDEANLAHLLFGYKIYPLRYISSVGELEYTGNMQRMIIDGDEPKAFLGGACWKDLYNTKQAIGVQAPPGLRRRQ